MRQPAGDKSGLSVRDHLKGAAKRGSKSAIAQLNGPELPETLEYLWDMYLSLERGRRYGMNGAEPFAYVDVDAWVRLTGRTITPDELDALMLLDAVVRHPVEPKEPE